MPFNLSPHLLDRELVFEFFWAFSVFECALKREGFLRTGRNDAAEADWTRFAKDIEFQSVRKPELDAAVEELRTLAPRRQVVRNYRLAWESLGQRQDEGTEEFALRLVKTVRNNLFHGGKYPDGPVSEISRDRKILRSALTILDACYELHRGIRQRIAEAA